MSQQLLKIIENAGTNLYLTNEGQYVAASLINARAKYDAWVHDELTSYLAPTENETAGSSSWTYRLGQTRKKLNELRKQKTLSDFLPDGIEQTAKEAANKSRLQQLPLDEGSIVSGTLYLDRSGRVVYLSPKDNEFHVRENYGRR